MASRIRRQRKTFCTECGADLDNFWLSHTSANYVEVLKHHLECQRTGRFKGSLCSQLFIVDGGTPDPQKTPKPLPPTKHAALKKAILKKIKSRDKQS